MSRAVHNILNRTLPVGVRDLLRNAAVLGIPSMRHLDMPFRLKALARNGIAPRVVYDIGAASGSWARLASSVWPEARVVGFEPNERERASLERTRSELRNFEYRLCFLGPERKTVRYSDHGTQTSILAGSGEKGAEMLVLDELVRDGGLPPPDFLKLDVQGYELEVLRGGEAALQQADVVMLEVSFMPFFENMPLVSDVVRFMEERRFAWYDVAGIYRRGADDALLQMDAVFLKRDHPLRRGLVA
jgi:FkbM family methyltransferase